MHQHPPPFKRFARERFDGTSLYGQRSAQPGKSHQSPPQIPLDRSSHSQREIQPQSTPMVEHVSMNQSTLPHFNDTDPRYAFNPREELQAPHSVSPVAADVPYAWRLRAPTEGRPLSMSTVSQRRQRVALRNDEGQRNASASSVHLLPHPQLRPCSVAGDYAPRSVSQPNTPSFYPHTQQQNLDEPPVSIRSPNSSSQPASSRRRVRSATGNGEANFTDEEFHLFVQATAGLGPEQSFRNSIPLHDVSDDDEIHHRTGYPTRTESARLPREQNSSTMSWAFQETTQVPQAAQGPEQQQEVVMNRPPMRRLETSPSALDLWLQPPSAVQDDDYVVSPIEDELPDYATSQAQAQAEQRTEAARRAKELRRRWEESRH